MNSCLDFSTNALVIPLYANIYKKYESKILLDPRILDKRCLVYSFILSTEKSVVQLHEQMCCLSNCTSRRMEENGCKLWAYFSFPKLVLIATVRVG